MLYLDNCATTPIDLKVVDKMTDVAQHAFGNPSSQHSEGRKAAKILLEARQLIADTVHAQPQEIVFTSSGTEANNTVICSVLDNVSEANPVHIITSTIEHASIRNFLAAEKRRLGERLDITELPVSGEGLIDPEELMAAVRPNTRLITLIHCNNETGALQDLESILKTKLLFPNVLLHLDIVQSYLKSRIDVRTMPVDFLTTSGHKIHGPRGIGFIYVRNGVTLNPLLIGGAQEKFRRAGTENLPAVAGFAMAVELFPRDMDYLGHMLELEVAFLNGLKERSILFSVNGPMEHRQRIPGFLNLSFDRVSSKEDLQIAIDLQGIQLSSTSACHSGVFAPSHVLQAMNVPDANLTNAVRLVFNKYHSVADAEAAAEKFSQVIPRLQVPGEFA